MEFFKKHWLLCLVLVAAGVGIYLYMKNKKQADADKVAGNHPSNAGADNPDLVIYAPGQSKTTDTSMS